MLLITRGLFSFPLPCTAASEVKSVLHIKTSTGGTGMRRERWRQYSPCTVSLHSWWPQQIGEETSQQHTNSLPFSPFKSWVFDKISKKKNQKIKKKISASKWLFNEQTLFTHCSTSQFSETLSNWLNPLVTKSGYLKYIFLTLCYLGCGDDCNHWSHCCGPASPPSQ